MQFNRGTLIKYAINDFNENYENFNENKNEINLTYIV